MIKLSPGQPGYPRRLHKKMKHPPEPLWLWGTLPDDHIATVGIVGTRRLTPLGSRIARVLAMTLARAGAVIVSGLAQGIDSTAHAAALDVQGRTIAVLGEGLAHFDEHGPLRRRQLAKRVRASGALISEYPLDTRGNDWTYPRRNQTIAALSDALIVVEAPRDSGALITAGDAVKMHTPVFVVPGPIDSPTWEGSNAYIAKGDGTILANVQQVAAHLRLRLEPPAAGEREKATRLGVILSEPADTDAIAAALEIAPMDAAILIAQELVNGTIVATEDGRFVRA